MLILCKGKVAETAYVMPITGQRIYSLEELCYYIYNNIYTITEEVFQESLVSWLRDETEQPVLAKKLENMFAAHANLKDLAVTILCAGDYYKEHEMRQLVAVMENIENLPLYKKKKIKADNYLRAGLYGRSLLEYRKLLHGSFAVNFTPEEYGDILHNQGIAHFYTSSFAEAEHDFKEAFVQNHKKESLQHYLWVLLMQEKNQMFEAEAISMGMASAEAAKTREQYLKAVADSTILPEEKGDIERYKKQLDQAFCAQ